MKTIKCVVLISIALCTLYPSLEAQKSDYIRIAGNIGAVVNSPQDGKFAIGGTASWLTKDVFISKNDNNFLTLSIKAVNNPFNGGKPIASIWNDKYDAFNYVGALAGYRFTQQGIEEGLYVEPRFGVTFGVAKYTALFVSPLCGYAYRNFDFGLFCDMGFGGKGNAVGKKNFFTPGVSIGYNIGL